MRMIEQQTRSQLNDDESTTSICDFNRKNKEIITLTSQHKNNQIKKVEEKGGKKLNRSLKNAILKVTINAALKSSVHCFPSFADLKTFNLVKIVWFLITFVSWSYWLYTTYSLYQHYLKYDTISSYSRSIDTKMDFPGNKIIKN